MCAPDLQFLSPAVLAWIGLYGEVVIGKKKSAQEKGVRKQLSASLAGYIVVFEAEENDFVGARDSVYWWRVHLSRLLQCVLLAASFMVRVQAFHVLAASDT